MVSIGEQFSRWTVLAVAAKDSKSNRRWNCRCECGVERVVYEFGLSSGRSQSCGCLHIEAITKHGDFSGNKETTEHKAWASMHARCYNPKDPGFSDYGARGITVCKRWNRFENFLDDMGRKADLALSLERVDNNAGYCRENCVWASKRQQARNRRSNRLIVFKGETAPMCDWADRVGLPYKIVKDRIWRGWAVEHALSEPVRYR